jgi:hypothetical protein
LYQIQKGAVVNDSTTIREKTAPAMIRIMVDMAVIFFITKDQNYADLQGHANLQP